MKKTGKPTGRALDAHSKEFIVQEYSAGNGQNTVAFIEHLQNLRPGRRIVLIWDGASYHKAEEMKEFLAAINAGKDAMQWQVRCILESAQRPRAKPC